MSVYFSRRNCLRILLISLFSIGALAVDRQTVVPVGKDWYFVVKDPIVQFFMYLGGFSIWALKTGYDMFFKKQDSISSKLDTLIQTVTHIEGKVESIERNFITKAEAQDKIMEGIKFVYELRER